VGGGRYSTLVHPGPGALYSRYRVFPGDIAAEEWR